MEDICSLWNYAENVDDLKQKLLYTTLELESVRIELNEETRKNEENVKHLLGLLKLAYQERDEAKSNFQKLLHKLLPQQFDVETPFLIPKQQGNNSSITESNNSCFSNNSSPVDSVFDVASACPPQALLQPVAGSSISNNQHPIVVDRASMIIDNLVRGKALPEKGRLREAVKQASDYLHRHLIGVGDLPKWRNPPPMLPHFVIAPVLNGGSSSQGSLKQQQHGTSYLIGASSSPYDREMMLSSSTGRLSQFIPPPMLSSGSGVSGLFTSDGRVSSGFGKRQRMQ